MLATTLAIQWTLVTFLLFGVYSAPLESTGDAMLQRRGYGSLWGFGYMEVVDLRGFDEIKSRKFNEQNLRHGKMLGQGSFGTVYEVSMYSGHAGVDASSIVAKVLKPSPYAKHEAIVEATVLQKIKQLVDAGVTECGDIILLMKRHPGKDLTKTPQYQSLKSKGSKEKFQDFLNSTKEAYCHKVAKVGVTFKVWNGDDKPDNVVVQFKDDKSYDIVSIEPIDWLLAMSVKARATENDIYRYCIKYNLDAWKAEKE